MDFTLSAEQQQFAASLHDLLAAAGGPAAARSWAAGEHVPGLKIWRALAGAGVTGLAVPESAGGLGAELTDLVVACEELGHHAVPGPVAESLAAVPILLAAVAGGTDTGTVPVRADAVWTEAVRAEAAVTEAARALHALASGELIATLAAPPLLPYAAGTEVAGLVLAAAGDAISHGTPGPVLRSVEAARMLAEVTPGRPLATGDAMPAAIAAALDAGTLANSAQLLGAGRALLEASARHARDRIQFGQPVGSFQAVKHHLADVLIGLEFARPLLHAAAIALGSGTATAARDVSAAKAACADAASRAARIGLQVHGAIGYTAEHDAGLWLTKIQALAPAWGSPAWHRRRVLAALAAGPDDLGPDVACG